MQRKILSVNIFLVVLFFFSINKTEACSCGYDSIYEGICESEYVALVKIKEGSVKRGRGVFAEDTYKAKVMYDFKHFNRTYSHIKKEINITTSSYEANCGVQLNYKKNDDRLYVVNGYIYKGKVIIVSCVPPVLWKQADDIIKGLKKLSKSKKECSQLYKFMEYYKNRTQGNWKRNLTSRA